MTRSWGVGRGAWAVRSTSGVVAGVAAVVVLAATPAAAQQTASPLQGFSIVLVQGDMAASDGRPALPDAAARAVGDMKGFLPFRSYHLVDSAWVLADTPSGLINATLKGPDNVNYDVVMEALPATGGAQRVAFRLRESGGEPQTRALHRDLETLNGIVTSLRRKYDHALIAQSLEGRTASGEQGPRATTEFLRSQLAMAERRVAELTQRLGSQGSTPPESRLEALYRQLDAERSRLRRFVSAHVESRDRLGDQHPDVVARRLQVEASRTRLDAMLAEEETLRRGSVATPSAPAGATLIETMFTMRLGETVVVGTSRTGVDKALVAVLTAVPQQKGRGGF